MPTIEFQGKTINCETGANLRQVLIANKLNLHNGNSKYINCRGLGTCGTCAVEIIGHVSEANWKDRARRSRSASRFRKKPPFSLSNKGIGKSSSD